MKGIVINLDSRPDRLESFRSQAIPFEVERFPAIAAERGQDGCAASHLAVISAQTEFPFAVFEDDCILLRPWSIVDKAMCQLPANWDALWLGAMVKKRLHRYSRNLYRLHRAYSLHAVIYNTKRMVDFVVNEHYRTNGENLDVFYCHEVQARFNCYIVYPMVATQRSDVSDIGGKFTDNGDSILAYYKQYVR